MNISSSSQFIPPKIASINSADPSHFRVGQTQIEKTGSVTQSIDQLATVARVDNHRSQITATGSYNNISDKQVAAIGRDVIAEVQEQREQELLLEKLERRQIQEFAIRDRQVRNHERAHAAAGGQYAGLPRYTFERGPDGINYAVGGEVPISAGPVAGDPAATIQKAQVVRRAALAPTEPSAQDRIIAAQASQIESQARLELRKIESQVRIAESEVIEARIDDRQVDVLSASQTVAASNLSLPAIAPPFGSQDSIDANLESRIQRLSDDLNLRVSRADPFGAVEPGQIFSQFI
ncbi:MAG: hypothetical protein ACI80S_000658 [Pseudohongiellaceae bacterium]|jgi:hypothetical protein